MKYSEAVEVLLALKHSCSPTLSPEEQAALDVAIQATLELSESIGDEP